MIVLYARNNNNRNTGYYEYDSNFSHKLLPKDDYNSNYNEELLQTIANITHNIINKKYIECVESYERSVFDSEPPIALYHYYLGSRFYTKNKENFNIYNIYEHYTQVMINITYRENYINPYGIKNINRISIFNETVRLGCPIEKQIYEKLIHSDILKVFDIEYY